jgi:hypothetical protein
LTYKKSIKDLSQLKSVAFYSSLSPLLEFVFSIYFFILFADLDAKKSETRGFIYQIFLDSFFIGGQFCYKLFFRNRYYIHILIALEELYLNMLKSIYFDKK